MILLVLFWVKKVDINLQLRLWVVESFNLIEYMPYLQVLREGAIEYGRVRMGHHKYTYAGREDYELVVGKM